MNPSRDWFNAKTIFAMRLTLLPGFLAHSSSRLHVPHAANSISGFSWIANVHSPGLTEYKFILTKDGELYNAARYLNKPKVELPRSIPYVSGFSPNLSHNNGYLSTRSSSSQSSSISIGSNLYPRASNSLKNAVLISSLYSNDPVF